jgi:hypothetical protein
MWQLIKETVLFIRIGIISTNVKLEFDSGVTTLGRTVDKIGETKLIVMNHSLF